MPQAWTRGLWTLIKPIMTQAIKPPPIDPTILAIGVPLNIQKPYAGGNQVIGGVVTCTMGVWYNTPTSYAYQWKSNAANATGAGATTNSYTIAAADAGHTLTCVVTPTNSFGPGAAATSNPISGGFAARGAEEERERVPPPHELNRPVPHNQPARGRS
jgi:hypothetical protein